MRTFSLLAMATLPVSCMKSGSLDSAEGPPQGTWVLESQEYRDSSGRTHGHLDHSSRACPQFLVITGDSIQTLTSGTATGPAAKTHANCYHQSSDSLIRTGVGAYASASNPHVRIRIRKDRLAVEQSVVSIGRGRREEILTYRKWSGDVIPEDSPCACGPDGPGGKLHRPGGGAGGGSTR